MHSGGLFQIYLAFRRGTYQKWYQTQNMQDLKFNSSRPHICLFNKYISRVRTLLSHLSLSIEINENYFLSPHTHNDDLALILVCAFL